MSDLKFEEVASLKPNKMRTLSNLVPLSKVFKPKKRVVVYEGETETGVKASYFLLPDLLGIS